jgi:hypothetical protein
VAFGLDGRVFEIDLSEKNAKALRKTLEPWDTSARRVSGRSSNSPHAVGCRKTSSSNTAPPAN